MINKNLRFLPIIIVCALIFLLAKGLTENPKDISQSLIGKIIPNFHQQDLFDPNKTINTQMLPKGFYLINVWGSWCYYCKKEWPLLMQLRQSGVNIVGLNYRDKRNKALSLIKQQGNPFILNIYDHNGKVALAFGVNGTPETYLINPKGIILLRYSGELTTTVWQKQFLPKIQKEQ